MQVSVTIPDDVAAQALASVMTPESYVQELIAARSSVPQPSIAEKLADLESFFAEITAYSGKVSALPDEAFSRESLYRDHD
jgi:hypothetical protein